MNETMSKMIQTPHLEEGYLELILGPMFSGKTTQIIQIHNNYSYIGKKVVVINFSSGFKYFFAQFRSFLNFLSR
jgi:thymidine kinase